MAKNPRAAITLLELIIAITLLGVIVIGFSSIELFSRSQVLSTDRKTQVQNEVSYALEHMSRNVLQGVGDSATRPLAQFGTNGFSVRIEPTPATPGNIGDDIRMSYTLTGNSLLWTSSAGANEILSNRLMSGVSFTAMPSTLPVSPNGLYINFSDNYTVVEIGLVGRYNPVQPASLDNPQVAIKSRLYTRSASAN